MEKFGCLPDELIGRATSRQLTELEALFIVKEDERRSQEWRSKLDSMGTGKRPHRAPR